MVHHLRDWATSTFSKAGKVGASTWARLDAQLTSSNVCGGGVVEAFDKLVDRRDALLPRGTKRGRADDKVEEPDVSTRPNRARKLSARAKAAQAGDEEARITGQLDIADFPDREPSAVPAGQLCVSVAPGVDPIEVTPESLRRLESTEHSDDAWITDEVINAQSVLTQVRRGRICCTRVQGIRRAEEGSGAACCVSPSTGARCAQKPLQLAPCRFALANAV